MQKHVFVAYKGFCTLSRVDRLVCCFGFNGLLRQYFSLYRGWSGGAMVLGKLPVPGRPTLWMIEGQGPIVLAVGAGGGCLDIFTLLYPLSLSLGDGSI